MKSSQTSSIRNRPWRLFAVLGAVTLLAAVLSMALGPVSVAPWDVLAALFSGSDGSAEARIVLYARLPRTAGCILAGAALAVSGALTQSVLANPLASPGTIGVNSGAGVAAAICCAVAPTSQALVPIAAFIGAMAATLLVLFIAERTGAAKITLVLAGVAISNVLSAGVDAVVTFAPDALNAYSDFRIGSLENLTLSRLAAPAIVTGAALIAAFSRPGGRCGQLCRTAGLHRAHSAAHNPALHRRRGAVSAARERARRRGPAARLRPGLAAALRPVRAACRHNPGLHRRPLLHLAAAAAEKGAHHMIELKGLRAGYHGAEILRGIDLTFAPGKVTVICGPNGCGKSTLLKAALGMIPTTGGEVYIDGDELSTLTRREIAQRAAYMPQDHGVPSITVRRMALHGRFPYLSYPRRYAKTDYEAAERALERADALSIADKSLPELSGGQRQRAYLAMALAQETTSVLMDEPTAFLDIPHQLAVMDTARSLAKEGRAVVLVLHDLTLALKRADAVAVMRSGELLGFGSGEEVYESGALGEAMGVAIRRTMTPDGWQYYYA